MAARVLTEKADDAAKAFDWRRETLERELGDTHVEEAVLLAMGDADLHDIVTAFERGCSPELLVAIYA